MKIIKEKRLSISVVIIHLTPIIISHYRDAYPTATERNGTERNGTERNGLSTDVIFID